MSFLSIPLPFRTKLTTTPLSGSITINDVQYKWKSKGTGSKLVVCWTSIDTFRIAFTKVFQLVNNDTKAVVVESHRRVTGSGSFIKTKTPRYMNLDIGDEVVDYTELILLTFLLVWNERVSERAKSPYIERCVAPSLTGALLMGSH